jgi:hypothetical protein
MDVARLAALELPDTDATPRRLGDFRRGAPCVIGPGDPLRYQHRDAHTADHAPMDAILASLRGEA